MVQKLVIVFAVAFCAVVLAAPQQQPEPAAIHVLRSNSINEGDGSYDFVYEQDNGQIVAEQGGLKEVVGADGKPQQVVVSVGQYSFIGPDGQTYWVNWTADENGFHPVVGTGGAGGIQGGANIDPNALKSLIG